MAGLLTAVDALAADPNTLYTQSGTDPTWQQLLDANAIPIGVRSYAGVTGSTINVANALVDVGQNANNPTINNLKIHTLGNTYVPRQDFSKWSRWYQEDGRTQVFRLFEGEYNVANSRQNAARIESFDPGFKWQEGDGWKKWQGTYTIIKPLNAMIFQAKNDINDWGISVQMSSSGRVIMNRRIGQDITLGNAMVGESFDLTVYDNGRDYQLFFNNVQQGIGTWDRPSGDSVFRWGMYVGDNLPAQDGMLFVTGAKMTSVDTPAVLLAGWDTWSSGSEAASKTGLGATGLATEIGDWREASQAASNDGTFGTSLGNDPIIAAASKVNNQTSSGTYIGRAGDGAYNFTITAGTEALSLDHFHFDAKRKRINSPENWVLEAISGGISKGVIAQGILSDILGTVGPTNHDDFDISLDGLFDNVLDAGESATFRLSFTGGNPTNTDQITYLDNVAITGNYAALSGYIASSASPEVPEPASIALLGIGCLLTLTRPTAGRRPAQA